MKKIILSLVMVFTFATINAQSNFIEFIDGGIGFTTDADLTMLFDLELEDGMSYGFQMNINLSPSFSGEDYTGVISRFNYTGEVYGIGHSDWGAAARIGKKMTDKVTIIAGIGATFVSEWQNRFDNYRILGIDGYYYVNNNNSSTELFASVGVKYRVIDNFAAMIGISSKGLEVGLFYTMPTLIMKPSTPNKIYTSKPRKEIKVWQ